jgi:hypothetical protein
MLENRDRRHTPRVFKTPLNERKVEALFDALAHINGWANPESTAYRLRNPLCVKSFALLGRHEIDEEGRRVFSSQLAGIKAGLFDLELKLRGESRAGIKASDKIVNVLRVYGVMELLGQQKVMKFFRRSVQDPEVTADTTLDYFLQTASSGTP